MCEGGNPTHLIYDNAWLFVGDGLTAMLKRISASGGQPGGDLEEAVRRSLPEALIDQLVKEVKFAHDRAGEAAVYRKLLEDLYKAADEAIKNKSLDSLHEITGRHSFLVPSESDVTRWGKDFLQARRRDISLLHETKRALEQIKDAAEKLETHEGSPNAELKDQIIKFVARLTERYSVR